MLQSPFKLAFSMQICMYICLKGSTAAPMLSISKMSEGRLAFFKKCLNFNTSDFHGQEGGIPSGLNYFWL